MFGDAFLRNPHLGQGLESFAQDYYRSRGTAAKTGYYDATHPGTHLANVLLILWNPSKAGWDVVGSGNAYSVAYQMKMVAPVIPVGTRYAHFKSANASLFAAMDADPAFARAMQQLIPDINAIRGTAGHPQGWVWNHLASEPGVMQLVPSVQHWSPDPLWSLFHPLIDGKNLGGFKLWGDRY